ncbi:hypothetical protein [Pseudodonghicola flavimaris]|uniref:Imelysin-like domain-containing protein n=1 Tax=Pseudodonghicola flavimaris TaxID=3050036 RepID=A0ABT7EUY8_9RHOB|nr:hypothetical protein [Pseudodonghicola flavimaris]MDK3016109.1 hypothetical protein [Pseudodonghicola flavimaris]
MSAFLKGLLFLGAVTGLVSCSSQPVNTLDNMTISVGNDGEISRPVNFNYPLQSRFLSVNGQLPVPAPGASCLASSFRVANSIICFSSDGSTHVLTRTFKFKKAAGDASEEAAIQAVKTALMELNVLVVELVAARASQAEAQAKRGTSTDDLEELAVNVAQASNAVKEKANEVAAALSRSNLFIFRWAGKAEGSGSVKLADVLSGGGEASRSQSGMVIVAGLTVSQLMIGVDTFKDDFKNFPDGTKIATLTMGAQHLSYFTNADISAALQARFKGTLESARNSFSSTTEITARAYAAIEKAQENQGLFSAPEIERKELNDYENGAASQQIFYATMTDIGSLMKNLSKTVGARLD